MEPSSPLQMAPHGLQGHLELQIILDRNRDVYGNIVEHRGGRILKKIKGWGGGGGGGGGGWGSFSDSFFWCLTCGFVLIRAGLCGGVTGLGQLDRLDCSPSPRPHSRRGSRPRGRRSSLRGGALQRAVPSRGPGMGSRRLRRPPGRAGAWATGSRSRPDGPGAVCCWCERERARSDRQGSRDPAAFGAVAVMVSGWGLLTFSSSSGACAAPLMRPQLGPKRGDRHEVHQRLRPGAGRG